jgi:hypothetical protein
MSMHSWIRSLFGRPVTRPIRKEPRRGRLSLEPVEDRWVPSTVTVTNLSDDPNDHSADTSNIAALIANPGADGTISLREAVLAANNTPGDNTINFAVTGMITLGGTELELTNKTGMTTITGPGVTVSGGGVNRLFNSRVFEVDAGASAVLSGLTITGGVDHGTGGGGLFNRGTVKLIDCTVIGNTASQVFSPSVGTGGGVYNAGTATLDNCYIIGNSAGGASVNGTGGGVYNAGTAILTDCSFSDNTSAGVGGGLSSRGDTLTLNGCNFSDNMAGVQGGGLDIHDSAAVTLNGCNIFDNTAGVEGGGVWIPADFFPTTLNGCDIEGNTAGSTGGGVAIGSSAESVNLIGCTVRDNFAGNSAGTGGGVYNAGTATLFSCEIEGNFAGTGGGMYNAGTATLLGGDFVFNSAAFGGGLDNESSASAMLYSCNFSDNSALYGGGVDNFGTVTLTNCAFIDNSAMSFNPNRGGGGLENLQTATLTGCTFIGNTSTTIGGGLSSSDTLTLNGCNFDSNSAVRGGGLDTSNGVAVTLNGCNFDNNTAVVDGGGVRISVGSTTTLNGCDIEGNTAGRFGGGVAIGSNATTVNLIGCNVLNNFAGGVAAGAGGGGVYNAGTATLNNCTISGNQAAGVVTGNGGGVFNIGMAELADCTISGNSAEGDLFFGAPFGNGSGGGVFNNGTAKLTDCTVSGNIASGGAFGSTSGGVFNSGLATLTNCTVTGNAAEGFDLLGNTVSGTSDGVFNSGMATLTNCTISANGAAVQKVRDVGAVVYNGIGVFNTGTATLTNTIVADQSADVVGPITGSNNLIGDGTGMSGISNGDAYANQVGTSAMPIDPLLGDLGDNGGPTYTMALLAGSPAINAGTSVGAPSTDQRHFGRVGAVDIGAYESPFLTVATTTTVTAPNATYDGSSHGATAVVTPGSAAGTVTFLYTGTGGYNSSTAPTAAGTYHVVATFTPNNPGAFSGSSGSADFTISRATLTGNATTQNTLNLAKQGQISITVSNVTGLVGTDKLSDALSGATFYLTIGTDLFAFTPASVTTSGNSITITYSLKNPGQQPTLAAEMASDLAGSTSASKAIEAGFLMDSTNYTLSDADLTRVFSTTK